MRLFPDRAGSCQEGKRKVEAETSCSGGGRKEIRIYPTISGESAPHPADTLCLQHTLS